MKLSPLQLSFRQELYSHQLGIFPTILTPGSMSKRWEKSLQLSKSQCFHL